MNLRDHVRPATVSLNSGAAGKEEVLRHVAAVAARDPSCAAGEEAIYDALMQRERMGSTGFENGIAIPHARLEGCADFVVGVVSLPDGVDFRSSDGQLTRLVVFILGPPERPGDHVKLLSAVSRSLSNQAVRDGLLAATDAVAVIDLLGRHTPAAEGEAGGAGSLVTVFVQIEKAFLDILQAVSSETSCISVISASDAAEFLHALPLYAVLWDDEPMPFHRVIIAAVERDAVPDLTAEIRRIAEGLESDKGVLVAVQDLSYCYGTLKAIPG